MKRSTFQKTQTSEALAQSLALVCSLVAVLVLIGWQFEIKVLKSILPQLISMKANTAVGFLLGALSLWGFSVADRSSKPARLAAAAALGMGLIGSLTLTQQILGISLGIDELLFLDKDGAGGRFPPGQLAPITAVNFILLCVSLLSLHLPEKPYYKVGQFLSFMAFITAFQAVIGYAFGVTYTFGASFYTQMALHTACLFCLLSAGILSLSREQGYMLVFRADGVRGRTSRILMAGALFIAPLLNVLHILGERAGLYDEDFGVLIRVVAQIVLFSSLVLWSSTTLYKVETHRSELDQKRRKLEQQLNALLTHAPVAIFTLDERGIFTHADGQGLLLLGRRPEELIGASVFGLRQDCDWVKEAVRRAQAGSSYTTEGKIGEFAYELHVAPVREPKGQAGIIGLVIDNTLRRKLEEERAHSEVREQAALEASRLKSNFLANMSHEIRTPIHGVLGMTGLLLDSGISGEQREYAAAAKRSGEALLTLINDILDFSKIEAGKLDFENISFHLPEAVDDVIITLNQQAHAKGLKLLTELSPGLPEYVEGDPGRLRQVLSNLVSNAIKFSSEGNVVLRVAADGGEQSESGWVQLRFEVEDSGIGIAESARARLFQPFSQADSSTTRLFGGTGLGLSISKHLVERMGGEIDVRSQEGEGSVFWFTARLRLAEKFAPETCRSAQQALPIFDQRETPFRILVAEDVAINQTIASKYLERMGFSVEIAANGVEALEAVQSRPFDLVLMDCHMPEMDGYQATIAIRALADQRFKDIPIIAMTANAMKGDMEKCLAAGMNDYLTKPIKPEALAKNLRKWVKVIAADQNHKVQKKRA